MTNIKQTILIVEDEKDLRDILSLKLTMEGYNVLEAENGKVGLDIAKTKHPDLILLDIIMPILSGTLMLRELQKDQWGKNVPIIFLSNLSESEHIEQNLEKNVRGYFVKSDWEPDDLAIIINKILKK
jgi:two-component system phosphate regulon response regulator PhoB